MALIRNLFALIGLACVGVIAYVLLNYGSYIRDFSSFDDKTREVYLDMARKLLESGNAADATIWKVRVKDGLTVADVEETIKLVANELNIKNVGELPLSKQVELETGKPVRYLKIYMFCNPQTAIRMVNYSDAFSAYLPCRISLVEDKTGKLWLYTLNMDLIIHGGKPLPPDLKQEALGIKKIIEDLINRGAAGDW